MKKTFLIALLAGFVSFTGCNSGNNQVGDDLIVDTPVDIDEIDLGDDNTGESTEKTKTANEEGAKTDTIVIKTMKFDPESLTVNKGDKIVWINKDIVDHNVVEQPGEEIKSDTLSMNQTFEITAEKSFDYICSIHPTMKAKITVK